MTKEYATDMWKKLLTCVMDPYTDVLIENPAVTFNKRAKAGDFENLSDSEYEETLNCINEESALFEKKPRKSGVYILVRALQHLTLTENELDTIAKALAKPTTRISHFKSSHNKFQ